MKKIRYRLFQNESHATAVPSTAAGKQKYKWNDQTVEKLIDLYEERHCLWDISDRSYSKRDVKEKALSEIKDELDIGHLAIKIFFLKDFVLLLR